MPANTNIQDEFNTSYFAQRFFDLLHHHHDADQTPSFHEINKYYKQIAVTKAVTEYTPVDDISKRYIQLLRKFVEQLVDFPEIFNDQNKYSFQEKMKVSADLLLSCNPDAISIQVTNEGSIFYTILKNDLTIYFQHYLLDEYDETDEVILNVFRANDKILDFGGTLVDAAQCLSSIIPEPLVIPQLA